MTIQVQMGIAEDVPTRRWHPGWFCRQCGEESMCEPEENYCGAYTWCVAPGWLLDGRDPTGCGWKLWVTKTAPVTRSYEELIDCELAKGMIS